MSSKIQACLYYYNTDPCLFLKPRRPTVTAAVCFGSPRSVTDKLQRVLNAAARVYNQQQEV